MMNAKTMILGGALASLLIAPGLASAAFVLDTGAPSSDTGAPVSVLSTSQFLADEFSVAAGLNVTSLSAYLTEGVGQPGDTFTFDINSSAGFTSRPSSRPAPVFTATGTFSANGWNSASVDWVPASTGTYWLALQVGSTTQTKGLDAPGLGISTTSGSAPALGFAYAGTTGQYALSSAAPVAMEITAAPVPLPATAWLFASGLFAVGGFARRRRPS